jgi:hypothetical protein
MATPNLTPAVNGATVGSGDINQLVRAFMGLFQVNGPVVQIATTTATTSVAAVDFSNIPAYTNLFLAWSSRSAAAAFTDDIGIQINLAATTSYVSEKILATGTAVSAQQYVPQIFGVIGEIPGTSATSTAQNGTGYLALPNWASTTNYASWTSHYSCIFGSTTGKFEVGTAAGQYQVTGTYNALRVTNNLGNIAGNTTAGGCTFTLYGSM